MAKLKPLWIYNVNGQPKTDAAPVFVNYVDKAGAARPAIAAPVHRGGGQYTFLPTDADEAAGTIALIDCGAPAFDGDPNAAWPRYQSASISTDANPFVTFVPYDENSNPSAGAPTVGSFVELDNGTPRVPQPAVVKAGALELYTATPSAGDVLIGVGIRLDSAGPTVFPLALNASFFPGSGSSGPVPVVTLISPALGNLDPTAPIILEITAAASLRFAIVTAAFPSLLTDELVYRSTPPFNTTGQAFKYRAAPNAIATIAGGFRITLIRNGDWPVGDLTITGTAVDALGQETAAGFAFNVAAAAPTPPPPESALGFTASSYSRQLKLLLPPGLLWLLEGDSTINDTLHATATEFSRVDSRGLTLIEEADPRTTDELLEDWERVLGIPDGCVLELAATLAERRNIIVQRLIARGGQSRAFFLEIAAAMGVTARIYEFRPLVLRAGFRASDRCYGIQWVHIWALISSSSVGVGLVTTPPAAPATPVVASAIWFNNVGGALSGGVPYSYRVAAINGTGETMPSAPVVGTPDVGTNTNVIRVNWSAITGATGYKVYGRTALDERLIAQVGAVTFFDDTGSFTPRRFMPTCNSAGSSAIVLAAKGTTLECVTKRAKPAQSVALFQYE